MNVKTKAGLLAVGLFFLGFGAGYVFGPYLAGAMLMYDHLGVARTIHIKDVVRNVDLELKFEGPALAHIPPLATAFPSGQVYKMSKWAFYEPSTNNVEAYMILSGPGVDGKTYGAEIVRIGWSSFLVESPTGAIYTFPSITAGETVSLGYVCFEFIP